MIEDDVLDFGTKYEQAKLERCQLIHEKRINVSFHLFKDLFRQGNLIGLRVLNNTTYHLVIGMTWTHSVSCKGVSLHIDVLLFVMNEPKDLFPHIEVAFDGASSDSKLRR